MLSPARQAPRVRAPGARASAGRHVRVRPCRSVARMRDTGEGSGDLAWDSMLSALEGIDSAEAEREPNPQKQQPSQRREHAAHEAHSRQQGKGKGVRQRQHRKDLPRPSRQAITRDTAAAWDEVADEPEDADTLAFLSRRTLFGGGKEGGLDGGSELDELDQGEGQSGRMLVDEDSSAGAGLNGDLQDLAQGLQSRWEARAARDGAADGGAPPLDLELSSSEAEAEARAAAQLRRGVHEEDRAAMAKAWGEDPDGAVSGANLDAFVDAFAPHGRRSAPSARPSYPSTWKPPPRTAVAADDRDEARRQRQEHRRAVASHQKQNRWRLKKDWALMEMGEIPSLTEDEFDDIMQQAPELEGYVEFRPMIACLTSFGLTPRDLARLAEVRDDVFIKGRPEKIAARQHFLEDVAGLSREDFARVLCKFPAVVTYKRGRLLKKLEFLKDSAGVAEKDLAKVFISAPSVMGQSLEGLQQKTRFLCDVVGVDASVMGRLIARDPSTLTRNLQADEVSQRLLFLTDLGLGRDEVGSMVGRHPQVLRYNITRMSAKADFLREIGMDTRMVARTVTSLPQIWGLDVDKNLRPKFKYLEQELGRDAATVATYPAYFSLSLDGRIKPRHRYLCTLDRCPTPFPMSALSVTDAKFATKYAQTSLDEYKHFCEKHF